MSNIADRQTVVVSINCATFHVPGGVPSVVTLPMNLRFAANELVVKNISYIGAATDVSDVVQIWCNITNDGLIGSFPNSGTNNLIPVFISCDNHFKINNNFQIGNFVLELQQTGGPAGTPASYNTQPLISSLAAQSTFGKVVITLEFLKLKNKELY